jgi:hypothetical protein
MHSKQVNFYLSYSDLAEIEVALRERFEFSVLPTRSACPEPELLSELTLENPGKERLDLYLAPSDAIRDISLIELPNSKEFYVDVFASPVVQLCRCFVDERRISRGRLYFITKYYSQDILVAKPDSFISWSTKMLNFVRRRLTKAAPGVYCGSHARALSAAGVILDPY